MSNEIQNQSVSQNEQRNELPHFGQLIPPQPLHNLITQKDRKRGFLTESDRSFLLRKDLSGQPARRARMRIRNRILNGIFDARHLRYVSDDDRQQIFQKASEDFDMHFREAVKEYIRFIHLGLSDYDVDIPELIKEGIRQAEKEKSRKEGKAIDVEVSVDIEARENPEFSDLKDRYNNQEELHGDELAALVNSPRIPLDVVDALYHKARQQFGGANLRKKPIEQSYSWDDPDKERAEKIVAELRDLVDALDIDTLNQYAIEYERLAVESNGYDHTLHELVKELDRVAPPFVKQIADRAGLDKKDMELLYDIIWNPDNLSVEESINEHLRPPTAGSDWNPSDDESLLKFISRVEVAREQGTIVSGWNDEHCRRWKRVRNLANFDPSNWDAYMQSKRISYLRDALEELIEECENISQKDLKNSSPYGRLPNRIMEEDDGKVAFLKDCYGDEVFTEALRDILQNIEEIAE